MPFESPNTSTIPALRTFYMYITGSCNMACRHCWIAPGFGSETDPGPCLDYKLFKQAIEEGLPLGLSGIKLTGGEPLLHPDFIRMVDFAAEKGLTIALETNGTLVTAEISQRLGSNKKLCSVSVSLDGVSASTHDYLRNIQGSFEAARAGVERLVKEGIRPQVIMSLFRGNADEIESFVRWACKAGCGSVKINIIQSSGRGSQMTAQDLLSVEELIPIGRKVEREIQKMSSIPVFFSWPMAFQGMARLGRDAFDVCDVLHILGILSTGEMALCGIGSVESGLVFGRLGEDRVADVWSSDTRLQRIRDSVPRDLEGICAACLFKNRCLGYCVAQNYHASKKLTAPFWFCDRAHDLGLYPEQRKRDQINPIER